MITILASPKPFIGDTEFNQRNAIASWKALHPDIEIILYGTGIGICEYANQMGLNHIPDIKTTEFGTPYLNAMTSHAARYGRYDIQAFLNCDIILFNDVLSAISNIPFNQFLLSNFRLNLPPNVIIDVTLPGWKDNLFSLAHTNQLQVSYGSDLFIFKRGFFDNAPDLVLGRGGVDNGICAHALRLGIPLIDATRSVICLHPSHGYDHISGGFKEVFQGKEKLLNSNSYGGWNPHIRDGGWVMIKYQLKRSFGQGDWLRAVIVYIIYRLDCRFLFKILTFLYEKFRRIIPSPIHITTVEEALAHLGYKSISN